MRINELTRESYIRATDVFVILVSFKSFEKKKSNIKENTHGLAVYWTHTRVLKMWFQRNIKCPRNKPTLIYIKAMWVNRLSVAKREKKIIHMYKRKWQKNCFNFFSYSSIALKRYEIRVYILSARVTFVLWNVSIARTHIESDREQKRKKTVLPHILVCAMWCPRQMNQFFFLMYGEYLRVYLPLRLHL